MIRLVGINETNLTPRQNVILNLINQASGLSRKLIQSKIKPLYSVSKPTLARDLLELKKKKLLRVEGRGKSIRHLPLINRQLQTKHEFR